MKKNKLKQKHTELRSWGSLLLAVVMVFSCAALNCYGANEKTEKTAAQKTSLSVGVPEVKAGSYVVISGSTSEIVYNYHGDRKLPIGNITKFMTAMVVLDNMRDKAELNNMVDISDEVDEYGDDFKKGDSVSVEDLLKAMLVGGSDEAAEALARYSTSKKKNFIAHMNSKAIELGLDKTHFTNPTGIYNAEHYSTATECALMAQAAMRYAEIKDITALDMTTIGIAGKKSRSKTFTNTNPLLASTKTSDQYAYIKGGIAGSMEQPAKYSQYLGVATKNEMQYIVCILEANEKYMARGAIELFDYGDLKASKNTIVKAGKCMGRAKVRGGNITRVKAYTETKGFAYIPPEGSTDLVQTQVVLTGGLEAPLAAGSKVGEYRIYVADELKGTVDLVIKKDVKEGWPLSRIYISNLTTVLVALVLLILLALLIRVRAINKRKQRIMKLKRDQKIRELAARQEALDEDRRIRNWDYRKYYDSNDMNDAIKRKR